MTPELASTSFASEWQTALADTNARLQEEEQPGRTDLMSLGRSVLAEVLGRVDGPVRELLGGGPCMLGKLVRSALHLVAQLVGSRLRVLGQLLHKRNCTSCQLNRNARLMQFLCQSAG